MALKLDYRTWLESKSEKPQGSPDIQEYPDTPAYYLTPEQMMAYMNAFSPGDLWMNPNTNPGLMDYPTTAMNYRAPWYSPEAAKNLPSAMFTTKEDFLRWLIPYWMNSQQEAQGVYEHEVAHARDPRTDPYQAWSFPNKGFTTYGGLSGGLLQREFPAMVAEERFRYGR